MGLGFRGRRIEIGTEPVLRAVREGRAALLLLASDAGESIARRIRTAEIPVLQCAYNKNALGSAFGRGTCAVLAVCDSRLATELSARLSGNQYGGGSVWEA